MVSSDFLGPVNLNVTMSCSGSFRCGNWTKLSPGHWQENRSPSVIQNWQSQTSSCAKNAGTVHISDEGSFVAEVCYSPIYDDGIILKIPFTTTYSSNTFLMVAVSGENGMYGTVKLEPTQMKTLFISQTISTGLDGNNTTQPYIADMFYNGHRTDSNTGTLVFRLHQFGHMRKKVMKETLLSVLGAIGGFSGISFSAISFFRVVFLWARELFPFQRHLRCFKSKNTER